MPSLLKMVAELGVNITPFQAGMRQAQVAAERGFSAMSQHLKGMIAGYFGWQALKTAVIGVAKEMANLKGQSDQLGITTDDVQKLGIAADAVGLSFQDMAAALMKFNKARSEGAFPGQQGSDLDVIRKLDLQNITDQQLRDLFGKTGSRMRAALSALQAGREEVLISKEDIERVDEAGAALKRLGREWKTIASPAIGGGAELLVETMKEMRNVGYELGEGLGESGVIGKLKEIAALRFKVEGAVLRAIGFGDGSFERTGGRFGFKKELNKLGIGAGEEAPILPVDVQKAEQVQKLRDQIERKMSEAAFGRANKEGKIALMKAQIKDADEESLKIHDELTRAVITQEEAERRLLEQKLRQVEAEERILDLKQQGNVGFESFRAMAQAGGLNSGAFKKAEESLQALRSIENQMRGGKIILGGR